MVYAVYAFLVNNMKQPDYYIQEENNIFIDAFISYFEDTWLKTIFFLVFLRECFLDTLITADTADAMTEV